MLDESVAGRVGLGPEILQLRFALAELNAEGVGDRTCLRERLGSDVLFVEGD